MHETILHHLQWTAAVPSGAGVRYTPKKADICSLVFFEVMRSTLVHRTNHLFRGVLALTSYPLGYIHVWEMVKSAPRGTLVSEAPGGTLAHCAPGTGGALGFNFPENKRQGIARDDGDVINGCLRHLLPRWVQWLRRSSLLVRYIDVLVFSISML